MKRTIASAVALGMVGGMMFAATPVSAASGLNLLKTADVYMDFENGISDVNGKYTVTPTGDPAVVAGKYGSGVQLVGGTSYLTVDEFAFGADSFTFTAWLYCNSRTSDPALAGTKDWDSGGNPGWVLTARDSDWRYNVATEAGGRMDKSFNHDETTMESTVGTWYHIALVVNRETDITSMYVNGANIGDFDVSEAAHGDNSYDALAFNIGNDGTGAYNNADFNFVYDEVATFKRALSEEEVVAVYAYNPDGPENIVQKKEKSLLDPAAVAAGTAKPK